jgi:hypothetical protein
MLIETPVIEDGRGTDLLPKAYEAPLFERLVLWPRERDLEPRIIRFERGKVNYIWSPHRTGKSCLWPALDYVLGAKVPRLPIGPVAGAIAWYQADYTSVCGRGTGSLARGGPGNQEVRRGHARWPVERPRNSVTFRTYMQELGAGLEQLPITPFGSVSNRDLVLLNHLPQHALGDPHGFVSMTSGKSFSKLKLGYLLQGMFGSADPTTALYGRYLDRYRSRQQAMRAIADQYRGEFQRLAQHAYNLNVISTTPSALLRQPQEVLFRELEGAVRRLTLARVRNTRKTETESDNLRSTYELGVLAGRIAELLRLSEFVMDELRRLDASTNEEFGRHEEALELTRVGGLEMTACSIVEKCIALMNCDQVQGTVRIDPEALSLFVEQHDGERLPLTAIGGQQNYVGYNIAALFAIHVALRTYGSGLLHPLIIIDQPSQAFFGENDPTTALPAQSRIRLERLYAALDEMTADTAHAPTLIVLERSQPEGLSKLTNSVAVEGWCGDSDGFLPSAWLP